MIFLSLLPFVQSCRYCINTEAGHIGKLHLGRLHYFSLWYRSIFLHNRERMVGLRGTTYWNSYRATGFLSSHVLLATTCTFFLTHPVCAGSSLSVTMQTITSRRSYVSIYYYPLIIFVCSFCICLLRRFSTVGCCGVLRDV